MTDDIVKLAALRQQRRPKTGRSGDTTLFKNKKSTSAEESAETNDQQDATVLLLEPPKSRATRRRLSGESDFDDVYGSNENKCPLPFVSCKVSDIEVKALISTSSKQSLISREMYSKTRSTSSESRRQILRSVLTLGTKQLAINLEVQDEIPDIVLGIDFLSQFKCEMNFRDSVLIMGRDDDVKLPFLPETEIPLKFRVHRNVAASF
ncbi:DNA damage-inducible protein 1-like [Haliotis rubra]|uniref:DNA damage-inducible protein 1-like n=1 Tax=Haliotis rubra TaxID=36100 RepID=UPI001EE627B7|nr:DNA damage-inducible protein 1-like [Haliotis rubra]XP_046582890.1 DNA damage-inducible protein 1-like [Haliotis rubra]